MKKILLLLFGGLLFSSISLGCFMKTPAPLKTEAAQKQLVIDKDNKITLGNLPINYDYKMSGRFSNGEIDFDKATPIGNVDNAAIFTYQETNYLMKANPEVGDSSNSSYKLHDGLTIADALQYDIVFYRNCELKWSVLEKAGDHYDFILDTVFLRQVFNDSNVNNMDYKDSRLFRVLNDDFYQVAFTSDEKNYLSLVSEDNKDNAYVTLPTQSQIKKKDPACVAGDLAILSKLSAIQGYDHAPYWTKTGNGDRKTVRWFDKEYTDCLLTDPQIGVRPVIRISTKLIKGAGGGGGTSSTPTNVNAPLIIGIITGVIGVGGVVAFFFIWGKNVKVTGFKIPGWYYAIIFAVTITCSISIIFITSSTVSGGGGSFSCTFKCGYYLQSTPKSSSGNAVQVGLNCYRFNSDGTVNFCAACETDDASDFWADSGNGTWKQNGCTLNVTYNSYYGTNSFKLTISGTKLLYGNTEAYHWVRGE